MAKKASLRTLSASISPKTPVATPQAVQLPGTVANSAGGFTFEVDCWNRLRRFLIIGSENGSYYITPQSLTVNNAQNVVECITKDGMRTVDEIVNVSDSGVAPKNNTALFALALCASLGSAETKAYALSKLDKVARIGTHLFQFANYADGLRGWGSGLRRAVAKWYTSKDVSDLCYQVVKYPGRVTEEGNPSSKWTHCDLLRKSHPSGTNLQKQVYNYITTEDNELPSDVHPELGILLGAKAIKTATTEESVISIIKTYKLPHELIPDTFRKSANVWKAVLPNLGMTALIRLLNVLTANGVLTPLSKETSAVVARLTDPVQIEKARLHPLNVYNSLRTYSKGHGDKGNLSWTPNAQIMDALEKAMYLAFKNVRTTGKNVFIGLDVSGSMSSSACSGLENITARDATAIMAMATVRAEKNVFIGGFSRGFVPLPITASMSMNEVIRVISGLDFDTTDCSLPMAYALQRKMDVDTFIVFTDNETYAGSQYPHQALVQYRKVMNKPRAQLIVCATSSTSFTIADPNDPGMFDICGFDSSAPAMISEIMTGF